MAEAFANHYGSDVLRAWSAGLSPIPAIPLPTVITMSEKNIDTSRHVPSLYDPRRLANLDILINMSGFRPPGPAPSRLIEWQVADPYGGSPALYREVRDDLEQRVMSLILELRGLSNRPARRTGAPLNYPTSLRTGRNCRVILETSTTPG
jgi:arsenate reductase